MLIVQINPLQKLYCALRTSEVRSVVAMRWKELSLLHVLFFLSFLVSGLLINMLQLLLYTLTVTVLGHRQLFRRINYYAIYAIYGQLLFLADWWSGSTVTYYGEPDLLEGLGKQHAVILMNRKILLLSNSFHQDCS